MLTEISAFLGSVKAASDIAKLIKESGTTLEKAEVKLQLAELIGKLADLKMEAAEIQDLLLAKNAEIRQLREQQALVVQMQYEKPYYFRVTATGRDGPFCQRCYDAEGKLIRLQTRVQGWWTCNECKTHHQDSTYRDSDIDVSVPRSRGH